MKRYFYTFTIMTGLAQFITLFGRSVLCFLSAKPRCSSTFLSFSKLLVLGTFLFSHSAFSQDPIREANLQLRHFFQYTYLASPAPPTDFLYDLSTKLTDSVYYTDFSEDTIHVGSWLRLYEEMWWAAYDTTNLPKVDAVLDDAMSFNGDTIPMGIMAFDFWKLKDDALTTGTYFVFDTNAGVIYDKPGRPSSPYLDSVLFSSCPLKAESFFRDPVFRVDPGLIFADPDNQGLFTNPSLYDFQIDFDDGQGYVTIDPSQVNHVTINYSTNGIKRIRTIITVVENGDTLRKSTARFAVLHDFDRQEPDCYMPETTGLTAGVYKGCESVGDCEELTNPIIYIRGYDILDNPLFPNTNIPEIYTDIGLNQNLADLRNYQYDLVIVEFDNITIDLRHNAAYLTDLVDLIKRKTTDEQQLVMIGHSTGSIIARVCLTYMESEYYQADDITPLANTPEQLDFQFQHRYKPHLMHKTRTYINFDGPQQGASLPMAYQTLYNKVLNFAAMTSSLGAMARMYIKAANMFLDAPAAQQLLIYHIYTKSGAGQYKNYTNHWRRDDFLSYFEDELIPDYPEFSKNVAIANGSFNGVRQRNFYTDLERVAGDYFIDSEAEIYGRVLGIKVPLFGYDLELKTNNSSSHFFQLNAGTYGLDIDLYWFGIDISWDYNSIFNSTEYGNLLPYCTDAAGYYGLEDPENDSWFNETGTNSHSVSQYYAFNIFQYDFNTGNGCQSFSSHVGWNGILSANLNYQTCTDGIQFGHVPTFSAFDLAGSPRNADVGTQSLSAWLSQTPFDVLITNVEPNVVDNPNRFHRNFNNNPIVIEYDEYDEYMLLENCIFGENRDTVRLINREIGEETMYVDNLTLNRPAEFRALFSLLVDYFNPFYEYVNNPHLPVPHGVVPGTYSRSNDLDVVANSVNGTLYTPVNFIKGSGSSIGSPWAEPSWHEPLSIPPDYWEYHETVFPSCCIDYYQKSIVMVPNDIALENTTLAVYPNPVYENSFHSVLTLSGPVNKISIRLYDMQGRLIYEDTHSGSFEGEVHINSVLSTKPSPGLYNLKVKAGLESFDEKLMLK